MSDDWLADALDRLAEPEATPGVRLGAVSIARHEVERLRAAIERVRALHRIYPHAPDYDPYCEACAYEDGWPCPTIKTLDGGAAS